MSLMYKVYLCYVFDVQSKCGVQGKVIQTSTLMLSSDRVLDSSLGSGSARSIAYRVLVLPLISRARGH